MRAAALVGADLAEIRIDLLSEDERDEWTRLLQEKVLPVVVTNRASWEGGRAPVGEPARIDVLVSAAKANAEYIDVELSAVHDFLERSSWPMAGSTTQLILSHHNFDRALTIEEVRGIYRGMIDAGADVCKVAMAAESARDNVVVFQALAEGKEKPMIMLAMGELGQCSRILAGKYGSYFTFASVGEGRESAPGQVSTEALTSLYRFRDMTESTAVYGVIGNPVSHSMSPALHNAAFANAGIDAVYVPLKVDDDIAAFISAITPYDFKGLSVTIPGKVQALTAMSVVEDVTAKIGAMNTVVTQRDGALWGYNTDWMAAISAIEEGLLAEGRQLTGSRVLCIGAGGAARSLAYGALARGAASVVIANRSVEKAQTLASEIGPAASAIALAGISADGGVFDVVMNTTSLGMHPKVDASPVADKVLRTLGQPLVFDAVYNPLETRLLREAAAAGCVCVSGVEMFVRQAAEQFQLWFPKLTPNVDLMRSVVMDRLKCK
jgi:3-dehydroquinate dehydratase / shikimate dehydrogenase